MQVWSYTTAPYAARAAAGCVKHCAQESVESRGEFTVALSGGRTPWRMLRELSGMALPWGQCHLFQVDERVAPPGSETRNLTHIESGLVDAVPVPASAVHPMPVDEQDLHSAATGYATLLASCCGSPPVLDLVVLGLGNDGHTASLVPGDPVLDDNSTGVAVTRMYQGSRRMTLTYPVLNAARRRLWLVTGEEKAEMLQRLLAGDRSIPAGRVNRDHALVVADAAAMSGHAQEKTDV